MHLYKCIHVAGRVASLASASDPMPMAVASRLKAALRPHQGSYSITHEVDLAAHASAGRRSDFAELDSP